MNEYKSLKNKKSGILGIVIAFLIVLELCSVAMLVTRMTGYSYNRDANIFSLTESGGPTTVRVGYKQSDGSVVYPEKACAPAFLPINIARLVLPANISGTTSEEIEGEVPGFSVSDKDKVWEATTDVEIFKVSYENGEGSVTVNGAGDKVIAPGTSNVYTFTLENSGEYALDYLLETEAFFSNEEYAIPVTVRLSCNDGYILGGEASFSDVMELNNVSEAKTLGAGRYSTYSLEWQWAFEGDDEYDTLLGNMAAEGEDLSLTIVIRTTATQSSDTDSSEGENTPVLGDDGSLVRWFIIALLALVALVYVSSPRKRKAELIDNEETE